MKKTKLNLPLVGALVAVIVFVGCVISVTSTVHMVRSRGELIVSANKKDALITLGQSGHEAITIGTGDAHVRLLPGTYQVFAAKDTQQAATLVTISAGKSVTKKLTLAASPRIVTPSTLAIDNLDALIDRGVTSDEVVNLRQALYNFNHHAQKLEVDAASVYNGPIPEDRALGVHMYFNLTIDGKAYKADFHKKLLGPSELILTDANTKDQVYDSGPITATSEYEGQD